MTTGWGVIRLSFYFEMTTGWGYHPVVILFWNDNRMGVSSDCHFILKWQPNDILIRLSFFLKCEPDGGAIRFLFFYPYKSDRVIVELKFYIRVQEEDIRVQEEFVSSMWAVVYYTVQIQTCTIYFFKITKCLLNF